LFNAKYKTISAENFAIVVHRAAGNILKKNILTARGSTRKPEEAVKVLCNP
jgi:hypothetical protein